MPIITIEKQNAHLVLDNLSDCQLMFRHPRLLRIDKDKNFAIQLSCLEKSSPILYDLLTKDIDFTIWDDQNFVPIKLPELSTHFKKRYKPKPQSNKNQYYSIFGEYPETLSAIAKDPRCKVSSATLRQRVLIQKMPVEKAMLLGRNVVKQRRQVMCKLPNTDLSTGAEWAFNSPEMV